MERNRMNEPAMENLEADCGYKCGRLHGCAPLATAWIPPQANADTRYEDPVDALTRGTLFPGLDLPFMNTVNRTNPYAGTPLGEVMALGFMVKELQLYLDTHSDDAEAFALIKETLSLYNEAKRRYVARFGALTVGDLGSMDSYDWVDGPWPWEFQDRRARS
ncbi:MAG: spore coat protein CotJB [Oscillospiraceae bacterium]|nr:spore coat protein CotJB [Oscillospiraceae bacterium]MBQ3985902.1 spore coat protein CotJB [Oscillospiraceae bacterium]